MASSSYIANSILAKSYADANDLATEMARFFKGGLSLSTLDTDEINDIYARLVADNVFVGNQQNQGKLTLFGASATGNLLSLSHAGTGSGESRRGVYLEATAGAGALTVKRNLSSGASDHLITMSENVSAFNVLNISSAGSASAVYIDHTGASGFGLEVNARGIRVNAGGLTITLGGLTVSAGGLTVTGATVLNSATQIVTGGLLVSAGGITTNGLTVTGSSISVNGTTFIVDTVNLMDSGLSPVTYTILRE